jgi:hypothetical protein
VTVPYGDLIDDLPAEIYHRDKTSLSVSGAKKLIPPSCPAKFKWELDHGQPYKREFDVGHAAHRLVLGVGEELELLDFPDFRTKEARAARDEARDEGKVPVLADDYIKVDGMARAIRAHPLASALFNPEYGRPEQSIYWKDEPTGIRRRGRLDWLPDTDGGRLIVPDFKTAVSSEPGAIAKAVASYGYMMQARWYMDGVLALGLAESVSFVFVFVEKTPPYPVTVVELDDEALLIGGVLNRQALSIYKLCTDNDHWPGYSDQVELISLPRWYAKTFEGVI